MARVQQIFRYGSCHINKSQPLGHGSYGAVYKAKCDQLPCAAKVLHPTFLDPNDPNDPGAGKIMQRFQQECFILGNIRHPNIVQYLGMTRDPESRLPVLLMELLDENLTKILEHSQRSLAYYVQVDICHDIASAVSYLHSNDLIHRDLSSNNVLIIAKRRAKVTDFGISKLAGAAPSMTPLTMCPGTQAYMPPEALDEPPVYTKKLDCFSEGVIMIQVCTRLWPDPGPRTKTVQDSRSPTGRMQMPVLEPERRKNHIELIDHSHGLLPIAIDCLHYQENERPSSEELCQRLAGLKETREYRESVEQVEKVPNNIAELERQIGEIRVREASNVQQICDQNQQLQDEILSKDIQLQQTQSQLQILQDEIQSKQTQLTQKEQQIRQLKQQLKEKEQVTAEAQQTNVSLQQQMIEKQQLGQQTQGRRRLSQPEETQRTPTKKLSLPATQPTYRQAQLKGTLSQPAEQDQSTPTRKLLSPQQVQPPMRQWNLGEWKDRGKAPQELARGAAVVDGNVAYFMHRNHPNWVCSYDSSTGMWSELPNFPNENSSLAIVKGLLTAIGGDKNSVPDNKLLTIPNDNSEKWVEQFPPMPTKRSHAAVVSTKDNLIVAGGKSESSQLDTVEVMAVDTLVWSTAASLPHPYSWASATICGDQLYMLGGFDKDGARTKSVLTCSLTKLLWSCGETSSDSVYMWRRIADVPVFKSTCAAVSGELVAVGGVDTERKTISAIHKYHPTTDSWDIISNMPTARTYCLVAVFPTNEMMVVGGFTTMLYSSLLDTVETVDIIDCDTDTSTVL